MECAINVHPTYTTTTMAVIIVPWGNTTTIVDATSALKGSTKSTTDAYNADQAIIFITEVAIIVQKVCTTTTMAATIVGGDGTSTTLLINAFLAQKDTFIMIQAATCAPRANTTMTTDATHAHEDSSITMVAETCAAPIYITTMAFAIRALEGISIIMVDAILVLKNIDTSIMAVVISVRSVKGRYNKVSLFSGA